MVAILNTLSYLTLTFCRAKNENMEVYYGRRKKEKQKVKEITDKLKEGLKELFESEKYKIYLSTMSKFHNYSFNNT